MELKEAIEKLKNLQAGIMNFNEQIINNKEVIECIDTVLEELNNRIPISEIEKILETTKQLREKEIKELGMSLRGSAVDILENILKEYKE